MSFTFNGATKIISVDTAPVNGEMILSAQGMYSAWKDWAQTYSNYWPAFRTSGGDYVTSIKQIGLYYFFVNGWRFKPYGADHTLYITGALKVSLVPGEDVGGSPFVPSGYNVHIETEFSMLSETSTVSTGSGLSPDEHNALMSGYNTTDRTMSLSMYNAIKALESGKLSLADFKRYLFNRENTVSGDLITEYVAGGDTIVDIVYDSNKIPLTETMQ